MRDVSLRMEFILAVDTTNNFLCANAFDNGIDPGEKIVVKLFLLDARIKDGSDFREAPLKGIARSERAFITHEDANLINLLPFILQREQ